MPYFRCQLGKKPLIGSGNQVVKDVVDALAAQTLVIEELLLALALEHLAFEGSDSLDNQSAVQ